MISNLPYKVSLKEEIEMIMNGKVGLSPSLLNWVITILFGAGVLWASILEIPNLKSRQSILEKDLGATKLDVVEMKTDIRWIRTTLEKKGK